MTDQEYLIRETFKRFMFLCRLLSKMKVCDLLPEDAMSYNLHLFSTMIDKELLILSKNDALYKYISKQLENRSKRRNR